MPPQAHVRSVEAIEAFRGKLLVYAAKARPVLEDACDEVLRTREWLEHDRWTFWERELRRRTRVLEEAQSTLFSARLSNLREARTAEQMAVIKARASVEEAQEKLARIKKWHRDFDHLVQPLLKELEHLRTLLSADLPKAAAALTETVRMLDAYAMTATPNQIP